MKMSIKKIIDEIIPPPDYAHRANFSNKEIIYKLNNEEKFEVEGALINMLQDSNDMLIIETLGYLKSTKSLPFLYKALNTYTEGMKLLIIASSIYNICNDNKMIDVAISIFKSLDNKETPHYIYTLIPAFYYLSMFNDTEINNVLKKYTKHKEYLVSYNAKMVLAKMK
jgi:hypothetical protein